MKARQPNIQQKCEAAVRHARRICTFGSSNKKEDIERTGGWVFPALKRYSKTGSFVPASECTAPSRTFNCELKDSKLVVTKCSWFYVDEKKQETNKIGIQPQGKLNPLRDKCFNLSSDHKEIILGAFTAMVTRQGNCARLMSLATKYLWENSDGIYRMEKVSLIAIDHTLLIVNRAGNNLDDPTTWGDAYIVDAWYGAGLVFHANDYHQYMAMIKDFMSQQDEYKKSLGFKVAVMPEEIRLGLKWSLNPLMHCYPVYEVGKKVEDYYHLIDYRFGPDHLANEKLWRGRHSQLFQSCMLELQQKGDCAQASVCKSHLPIK